MDLTIGSLNFRVGSLGSIRLSDPMKSGQSAEKTTSTAMSELSVGSSSEVNSPVSFTTMEKIEDTIEELDETMENLDLGEQSGDFMICCGSISNKSTDRGKQDWSFMRTIKPSSQASAANSTISTKYLQS
jgi:hypothetical protein